MKTLYIIGAGGTASYLLPVLCRMIKSDSDISEVVIIDRDVVETKNTARQLFDESEVGGSKAELLAKRMKGICGVPVVHNNCWFSDNYNIGFESFIVSCTDNHPARLAVLDACDKTDSEAVICGNEKFSADAYYYNPSFKGTNLDPRVRYPEIVTDKSDDPTRPSCNSTEALDENPQLAAANSMSANLAMQLIALYGMYVDEFPMDDPEVLANMPVEYSSCRTSIRTLKHKEVLDG